MRKQQITSTFVAAMLSGLTVLAGHAAAEVTEEFGESGSPQQGVQNQNLQTAPAAQTGAKGAPAAKAQRKIQFGPLLSSPQVTNSVGNGNQTAIIAVLQKQKQAADAEAAQMKLGIRPQAKPTATVPGRSASNSTSLQKTTPGTVGPEKTMDSTRVAMQTAPQFSGAALVCAKDPTMRVLTVSGEAAPATFTSDDQYNFYTIVGCSFGDPGPNSKVYIYYQNIFREDFQIQEWNDNGIKLGLKPNLSGLLDHDNLTLVVQRADGKEATKGGFKFYAAREVKPLTVFPRNQFSLWGLTLNDTSHLVPQYVSPSQVPKYAAEVWWDCTNCFAKKGGFNNVYMQGNEDVWQLKTLQPGFVVQSYGMAHRNLQCEAMGYQLHTEGAFGMKLVGTELHAQWQGQTCIADGCGGAFQPDCFAYSGSDYLIDVMVSGPRGVDPWTGKPTP
jgi:hypothetical protein